MDILGAFNQKAFNFDEARKTTGVGFISGPLRLILAVSQIALNIFLLIVVSPFKKEGDDLSASRTITDIGKGFVGLGQGFFDILPGSSRMGNT
jgi:hypothetical protein